MKVSVDDKELFQLTETQKKVIMNDIHTDCFNEDMCRRLQWVLMHKYEQCFDRLKAEWEPRLAKKYDMLPSDKDKFAELIFSDPEYQSRAQREK